MISGDNKKTASAVASQVGIPAQNVIADVLPTEKVRLRPASLWQPYTDFLPGGQDRMAPTLWPTSKRCKDWPRCCGYGGRRWVWLDVGSGLELISSYSGINDAPALTAADVGIAVASGSDVAISSASFILLTSDLRSLVTLRDLARTTIRRVKFNFVSSLRLIL